MIVLCQTFECTAMGINASQCSDSFHSGTGDVANLSVNLQGIDGMLWPGFGRAGVFLTSRFWCPSASSGTQDSLRCL